MNNIFVFCEIAEPGRLADVSLELLSKARTLAKQLNCEVEALVCGHKIDWTVDVLAEYGVSKVHLADDPHLEQYSTLPYTRVVCDLFSAEKPQIALFGASNLGRDLGPRVSSQLHSGLTADCTDLQIGEYTDAKTKKKYENLLFQIRPAFGGNIIATIVNPDCRPQMATVREGVMRSEKSEEPSHPEVNRITTSFDQDIDFVVRSTNRYVAKSDIYIKDAPILVSGGYGVGSAEGFKKLHELAHLLGGEVSASRAAVDAGFAEHARQVGQTGVTVRPKLYIACGISGQVQHTAGMSESAVIISINTDPHAPIHQIADYAVVGDYASTIDKFIESYKRNSK